jgi:hypothetical protein
VVLTPCTAACGGTAVAVEVAVATVVVEVGVAGRGVTVGKGVGVRKKGCTGALARSVGMVCATQVLTDTLPSGPTMTTGM